MDEYIKLGHMTKTDTDNTTTGFYLPHHAVIKQSSQTTKVRVVFDGSAKSSTGISLNETLMTGPTIQDDIIALVLRFRLHKYVLTGDIEKMYRQFRVRKEDRIHQKIIWRDEEGNPSTYQLNTVTFGLSAAPFLAIRCLKQLAEDEAHHFPTASEIIKRDLYVDDLITGADTPADTIKLRDEIIQLLHRGGMNIRQWASNDRSILSGLSETSVKLSLSPANDNTIKTLGIFWESLQDRIVYSVQRTITNKPITKRTILADVARIYDPFGLLGPVVVTAKILIQRLWTLKLHWDESVPLDIHTYWTTYYNQLETLNNLSFPRKTTIDDAGDIQLHGFCDASEKAYGACIYLRSYSPTHGTQRTLLCTRPRVAPLKVISLPRLELCGALLLWLYESVTQAIHIRIKKAIFWTDSTIVLHWIHTQPSSLKTFVVNRTAEIRERTSSEQWRHVPTEDNPADALSRGLLPTELTTRRIWQSGPPWLVQNESSWPHLQLQFPDTIPESRNKLCFKLENRHNPLLLRYFKFTRLIRITARCRRIKRPQPETSLQPSELEEATKTIIKLLQEETFQRELQDLNKTGKVHNKSKLITLNPFLDKDGIIRVGGRLTQANLTYDAKHPIVIPKSHHVTDLIIRHHDEQNLHAGAQTTLYNIRQKYWLLDGRNQTRKLIRNCMRCFRAAPPTAQYLMGYLPAVQINEALPFTNVGIDYYGPFYIKVFVCLAVKAVHFELTNDLSTEAFIASLKRFIARRGKCRQIYSDNGTNFVGANNELRDLQQLFNTKQHQEQVHTFLSNEGIDWHFSPPQSPNFGGLWESTVRSFKHHLKRVSSNALFTYEEFNTFLTQVESVLNSRPITTMSADPNDLQAFTPEHFLIGRPLTELPEHNYNNTPINRLSSWQHISKIKRDFWVRWHKEYLNGLNIRHKWTKEQHTAKEGSIVILREDNVPPAQWTIGKIVKTYPGADGMIRVVDVKTPTNCYRRNVKKLTPLPINGH